MNRNIKLLAGMNVLAWIVIVPVLAIALVDSPVRLADDQGRPQDRLDGGIVALGHPPAPARKAAPGAQVGLNVLEDATGRVQSVRTSAARRSAAAGSGSERVSPNLSDRASSDVRRAADLRGEIGEDQAGGQAPVGRVRPNTGGAPAPGTTPTPDGTPPQTDIPAKPDPAPQDGTQQPSNDPPPISARPSRPAPDPSEDPAQSPPDDPSTPPSENPAPPAQPPADPPPPDAEPSPAPDPPGTMGGPTGGSDNAPSDHPPRGHRSPR